ncbi:MAG TPA: branched-chain amino acid ABC transporter permease, partial [Thermoflexales bacterium]|nr:branched-chain amino acid ABC transporter permease [Thermoflexales bacterium]
MKQLKNAQPALITGAVVILFLLALFGRFEPKVAVSVLLSGLTLGALYFMMSAGLSLIFGLMDVLNFAHGFLFMLGAYVGLALFNAPFLAGLDSNLRFVLALVAGGAGMAVLGAIMEWSLIRPLYSRPIYQVLLTLGLTFVGGEAIKAIWGTAGFFMPIPALPNGNGPNCPSPDFFSFFKDNCSS